MSPALEGGLLTRGLPGKSPREFFKLLCPVCTSRESDILVVQSDFFFFFKFPGYSNVHSGLDTGLYLHKVWWITKLDFSSKNTALQCLQQLDSQ